MLSNRLECHKVCHAKRHDNLLGAHSNRRCFPASPIDTATPQENQRLETRHVDAEKRAFRARLPPILTFSTRYQTGWNVTKCHACHAKRHDNLLGHIRKERFCGFPHRHGDPQENQRLETRHVGAPKRAFRARLPAIFTVETCDKNLRQVLQLPP